MEMGALWAVAIPLIAFKICFAIMLLSYAPTRDGAVWIAATHWPLILIVGLLVGPGIATWRLLRARSKRAQLERAEWMIGSPRVRTEESATAPSSKRQWSLWETVSRLEDGD
jgi:cytochrome oxidase assembly protein ShyY1